MPGDAMPTRYRHLHAIHRLFRGVRHSRSPWPDACSCDSAAGEAQFRLAAEALVSDRASTEIPTLSPNKGTIAGSKRCVRMNFALRRRRHGPAQRLVREMHKQLPSVAGRCAIHQRLEGRTSVIAKRLPCDRSSVLPSASALAASVRTLCHVPCHHQRRAASSNLQRLKGQCCRNSLRAAPGRSLADLLVAAAPRPTCLPADGHPSDTGCRSTAHLVSDSVTLSKPCPLVVTSVHAAVRRTSQMPRNQLRDPSRASRQPSTSTPDGTTGGQAWLCAASR